MIVYIEELLREINILNWYRGEAAKNGGDMSAEIVQSDIDEQEAMMGYIKGAVNTVLLLANSNRVEFRCERKDDALHFSIAPVREGKEYLLEVLKEAIRLFLVAEVRLMWMLNIRKEWADATMRDMLIMNIKEAMSAVTSMGNKIRRRATTMGI
jgi:hypothetical protein